MTEYALSIKNLSKTYKGDVVALDKVDLKVQKGDFFALLGPNGAGKSTMIGIITSLVSKSSGDVSIFGHDLEKKPAAAKSCIGLVPQEINFSLFETVIQIVVNQAGYYGIDRKTALARAEVVLKELQLWNKRNTTSRHLSGGMKRRLMIARALLHNPKLLILDEPSAGVDIELRRSMWEYLKKINHNGTTIILTTHYLEEAEKLCKNIAIINKGHIIENTSIKELLKKVDFETIILDLINPIYELPENANFKITIQDKTTLEVEIKSSDNINELFIWLNHHDVLINSMRSKSNRLEELFIHMVRDENGATKK